MNHASCPFCSVYFGKSVSLFAQTILDHALPILVFRTVPEMTDTCHHIQLFSIEIGSYRFLSPELAWKGSSQSQTPK
jgi:hypothetical protein